MYQVRRPLLMMWAFMLGRRRNFAFNHLAVADQIQNTPPIFRGSPELNLQLHGLEQFPASVDSSIGDPRRQAALDYVAHQCGHQLAELNAGPDSLACKS